jgi:RNA polymerase sigma factor (sigma-70 family)
MASLLVTSEDGNGLSHGHFTQLIERARLGDGEAVGELLSRYTSHIQRVVRAHLHRRLRARFDSQDFVQAVCASVVAHQSRLQKFERPEELIAYLGAMAANKVIDECRRCLTYEKRNLNRERSLADAGGVRDPGPTASQAAVAREIWQTLLADQPAHYLQIIQLRAAGATFDEIAAEVGLSARQVRRVIRSLSERLGG